jgi:hypothetical protein
LPKEIVLQPSVNPLDINTVSLSSAPGIPFYYIYENCSDRVYENCKNLGVVHIFCYEPDWPKRQEIIFVGTLQMAE